MSESTDFTPLAAARVTALLPRDTFADFTQWPGWDPADPDEGAGTDQMSVLLPDGWTLQTTTGENPVRVLRDAYQHARFAVLPDRLVPISDEDAGRY